MSESKSESKVRKLARELGADLSVGRTSNGLRDIELEAPPNQLYALIVSPLIAVGVVRPHPTHPSPGKVAYRTGEHDRHG